MTKRDDGIIRSSRKHNPLETKKYAKRDPRRVPKQAPIKDKEVA